MTSRSSTILFSFRRCKWAPSDTCSGFEKDGHADVEYLVTHIRPGYMKLLTKGIFFWRDANPADLELQKKAAAHRQLERSENCWIILPTRNCFCQRTAIGQCNLYLDILFVSLRNALCILLKWIRQMRHTLCMTSCIPAQMITFNQYQTLCLLELQMNQRMSFAAFCNGIRSNCICKKPKKFNLES